MNKNIMERSSYSLMYSLRKTQWTVYSAMELAILVEKNLRAVQKKAVRQLWPYHLISQPGRHKRIYVIVTLPDDIQEKWASLEENRFYSSNTSSKSQNLESDIIIVPVNRIQAEVALSWPVRENYYKVIDNRQTKGPKQKVYDGISQGLCPSARRILLNRFPELEDSQSPPQHESPKTLELLGTQQLLEKLLTEKDKRIEMLEHYAEENKRLTNELRIVTAERDKIQQEYMELLLLTQQKSQS